MRTPPIPYHDLLRLEVETTPNGLPNLVQNPSGETGAWGWITPVASTYMYQGTHGGQRTIAYRHTNAAATAGHFTTEFLPATAGMYYAARADVVAFTAGHNVKARFEWYDVNKALLSSSTQTTAWGTAQTYYLPAVVAPASAAFVKLRLDFYNGTGNPSANSFIDLRDVMVTYAATTSALQTTRVNRIVNPSFETNITGWTDPWPGAATMVRSTAQAFTGTASLAVTRTSSGTGNVYAQSPQVAVTPGTDYAASFQVRGTTSASVYPSLRYFDVDGNPMASTSGATVAVTSTGWTQAKVSGTTPPFAATVAIYLVVSGIPNGGTAYLDAFLLERGTITPGSYFDGSFTSGGGFTYTWSGTAHASNSNQIATSYAFSEPVTWRNILGPAATVTWDRKMLDVGTFSATIFDADLDPSTASEIRPGKRLRLRVAHSSFSGGWESAFEGKINTANAAYLRKDDGIGERVQVDISAVDNIATLANQGESRGVATIAALPFILEGKGVPWSVNGSGNQVPSATVVSANDNASVLDQVAITRDTALGQAFVDRNGVLVVRTAPTTVTDGFTDVAADWMAGKFSYTDIEIDFSSDNLINEVAVTWLRYNSTTKETEEVIYGPYRDQASIDTWGVRSATFTIHGANENPTTIAAYAQTILTANAQPVARPRRLVMYVERTEDLVPATQYDLGVLTRDVG